MYDNLSIVTTANTATANATVHNGSCTPFIHGEVTTKLER